MSSCSSDADVVRTRISTCGSLDDLFAYEPRTAHVEQNIQSDSSGEELQKSILDVLKQCQSIQGAVENLDKKFKAINGKVSKIYRFRAKFMWQIRKPLGYAYRHYTYLLSRKIKLPKIQKDPPLPASFFGSQSYSPTVPVRQPTNDSQLNFARTYSQSQDSLFQDRMALYDDQNERLSLTPTFPSLSSQPHSCYTPSDPVLESPSRACFANAGAKSTTNDLSSAQAPTSVHDQGKPSSAHSPQMMPYSTSATATELPKDPATWSTEDVILFLKQVDSDTSDPLVELFRQHDIDGKALLLLHSDIMIKYMGLKLGTALKLCHYIEKLKGEKCFDV